MIPITVIARKGNSVMVECVLDGVLCRRVLAHQKLSGDYAPENELRLAAPYGVPVAELADEIPNGEFPNRLENACRSRGLWTKADFAQNPTLVQAAYREALQFDITTLLNRVAASDD